MDLELIVRSLPQLAHGLLMTLMLVGASLGLGVVLGGVACAGQRFGVGLARWVCTAYVSVTRCVPDIVVMFWVYYCAPFMFDAKVSSLTAAIASMSLYAGAFLAEVFTAGIEGVPRGQTEAAHALGLSPLNTVFGVVAPQALRLMIPTFIGVTSLIVKVSGVASTIGVAELVYEADLISAESYRYFTLYSAIGVCYFAILFPLSMIGLRFERKLKVRQ